MTQSQTLGMRPLPETRHDFVAYGLAAALYLGGAVPAVVLVLLLISNLVSLDQRLEAVFTLGIISSGLLLGGGLWGRSVARRAGLANSKALAWASGVTFAVSTFLSILVLAQLEEIFVQNSSDLPIHVVFALLFTAAVSVVTALVAFALGRVAANARLGLRLALRSGAAAGLAFLLADMAQDLLGRRVGGPGAEETFTMVSVMLIGNLVAAFAGGAVMGRGVSEWTAAHTRQDVQP